MNRRLPPAIAIVADYLEANHPKPIPGFDAAIRDCAQKGFGPALIMCGLEICYGIPSTGLKSLVASHPVWGDAPKDWDALHDALAAALPNDNTTVSGPLCQDEKE